MSSNHVVILTALSLEYDEARARLSDITARSHPAGTRFEIGRLGDQGCRVALALTGKGNHPVAVLTERAITEFSPVAVIFAGVAGALQAHVALGDVVVATHVYAYHGATSEDDGAKARPRVWEISHKADQAARHVVRDGRWTQRLPVGGGLPDVHFGPIAAGEVVQDSAISAEARWIRQHYNDALAIEMEAAGVAQAGHLNDSLPVAVVRGISDRADGTKAASDHAGWQPRAVAGAAAFALALAAELSNGPAPEQRPGMSADQPTAGHAINFAAGHARVGVQAGQIFGGVRIGSDDVPHGDMLAQLAELRVQLARAYEAGQLDADLRAAAEAELDVATEAATDGRGRRLVVALKRLYGLISDVSELAARLAAIISAAKAIT
jgi:adenosylhomocysteine nucleosidase